MALQLLICDTSIPFEIEVECEQLNEMNGGFYTIIGETGPGQPPEDGEMNDMKLPSRQRIRNTSPGGLRPSTRSQRFSIILNLNANKMMRL